MPEQRPPSRAALVGASIVTLAAFIAIHRFAAPPLLHFDTVRDLLTAHTCIESGRCPTMSAVGSFGGLAHGGLWIRFIVLVFEAGGGPAQMSMAVHAVSALSVGVIFYTGYRFFGAVTACTSAVLAGVLFAWLVPAGGLWGPSVMPLPLAVLTLALLELSRSGRLLWTLIAAASLELVIDAHIIGIVLLPATLFLIALCAIRLWPSLLIALCTVSLLGWHFSADAMIRNLSTIPSLVPFLAVLPAAGTAGLAWWIRGRWASWPARLREAIVLGTLVAAFGAAWLAVPSTHKAGFQARYALPLVPALALIPGLILAPVTSKLTSILDSSWATGLLALACSALALWQAPADQRTCDPDAPQLYTLGEARKLTQFIREHEALSYADFARVMRGPGSDLLVSMYRLLDPVAAPKTPPTVVHHVRTCRQSGWPLAWSRVELSETSFALVSRRPGWVRTDTFNVCFESKDRSKHRCLKIGEEDWQRATAFQNSGEPVSVLGFQRISELREEWIRDEPGPFSVIFELPVVVDNDDAEHRVLLPEEEYSSGSWRLMGASGDFASIISDREIWITGQPGQTGVIRFSSDPEQWSSQVSYWLPNFIELSERDRSLRPETSSPSPRVVTPAP